MFKKKCSINLGNGIGTGQQEALLHTRYVLVPNKLRAFNRPFKYIATY